jgi:hypothetical protein
MLAIGVGCERLVQSAKKHLKVLSEEALDSDVFVTILGGVECYEQSSSNICVSRQQGPRSTDAIQFFMPWHVGGFYGSRHTARATWGWGQFEEFMEEIEAAGR